MIPVLGVRTTYSLDPGGCGQRPSRIFGEVGDQSNETKGASFPNLQARMSNMEPSTLSSVWRVFKLARKPYLVVWRLTISLAKSTWEDSLTFPVPSTGRRGDPGVFTRMMVTITPEGSASCRTARLFVNPSVFTLMMLLAVTPTSFHRPPGPTGQHSEQKS